MAADDDALYSLRNELVRAAEALQSQQQQEIDIAAEQASVALRMNEIASRLDARHQEIAGALAAMVNLSLRRPQLIWLQPDQPLQLARSQALLATRLAPMQQELATLQQQLAALQELQAANQLLSRRQQQLRDQQPQLNAKLNQALAARPQPPPDHQAMAARLAARARDISGLIRDASGSVAGVPSSKAGWYRPAAGNLAQPFQAGQSQGQRWDVAPGAVVLAPNAGIVRYAGDFRGYGQILIIQHAGEYHSLLAGLGKILTHHGAILSAGEPIALMPSSKAELYYEIRHQGRPIDPSTL